MANTFVGDNDESDTVPLSVTLWAEITQLRKERDEARREVCDWSVGVGIKATSQEVAEDRGWDCYKEKNDCTSNE